MHIAPVQTWGCVPSLQEMSEAAEHSSSQQITNWEEGVNIFNLFLHGQLFWDKGGKDRQPDNLFFQNSQHNASGMFLKYNISRID